jgi:drug/metabolite transporter (DMT)-like permease
MLNSDINIIVVTQQPQQPRLKNCIWWFRVSLYIIFLLAGQSSSLLLERLYYDKGGNSKWMISFVQSAGFLLLLPLIFYFKPLAKFDNNKTKNFTLYIGFGILLTGVYLMYSYGLQYLPLSTFSLICSTELAFNALFSYFLNSQKFTALIFNSVFLLTMSTSLLAVDSISDQDSSTDLRKENYILGFLFTLCACATFSLYLALVQFSFEKIIKRETFSAILDMQFYPSFFATCACVIGLFASGEWKILDKEMKEFANGKVSYIMTLLSCCVTWQICYIGMLGLVFEVSSLFANIIGSLVLPLVSTLSVLFFHDKIDGVKSIALMLAIWGFLSYIYQNYLDDKKAKVEDHCLEVSRGEIEV